MRPWTDEGYLAIGARDGASLRCADAHDAASWMESKASHAWRTELLAPARKKKISEIELLIGELRRIRWEGSIRLARTEEGGVLPGACPDCAI